MAKKSKQTKPNHRKLMEQAIEVMKTSTAERRSDRKATPKVGAVLLKPDGSIDTASRGELREGDHAEFTLLERKNRHVKLDGSILFATLEPCAPDARSERKLGCAERIVLARVKEVWVGIEDPDPKVDRKGINYLQTNGVTVHMFDSDLQEQIRLENKEFLEQALERAEVASEPAKKETALSPLESGIANTQINSFSAAALERFRATAKIPAETGTPEFNARLQQLGLVSPDSKHPTPTGFGVLLFGSEPRLILRQAGLLATNHIPEQGQEVLDFDGPMVLIPEQALDWLRHRVPSFSDRSRAQRTDSIDVVLELAREGIVNALVHRDYGIEGAKCQLILTPDLIEVRSPGRPVDPTTLEQLQELTAPALSRNPVLHYVFSQMKLAEERGLGLNSMRTKASQAGLPRPQYSWEEPYLVLRIYLSSQGALADLPDEALEGISEQMQDGLLWLFKKGRATKKEYAKHFELPDRTAQRQLGDFVKQGLVRQVGSGPSTAYEFVWKGRS